MGALQQGLSAASGLYVFGPILIEVWGAGGGGGTVINTSLSREGGDGGIRAAEFDLSAGDELEYFVPAGGQGGRGSAGSYAGGTGGASGAGAGGNGNTADGNQSGGGGGGAAGVRIGSTWLITAGGGGGGSGNDNEAGYDGGASTASGSSAPSNTGGSGGRDGQAGASVGARAGGGGGGGSEGGSGGGVPNSHDGGRGGRAEINSTTYPGTLDGTAESSMVPKAGGAYGRNAANASDGAAGQVRISTNGVVLLDTSTPGTGTITL